MIIEVDGNIHATHEIIEKDIERQRHLEAAGISFLRFTNEQIELKIEEVSIRIEDYIIAAKKYRRLI